METKASERGEGMRSQTQIKSSHIDSFQFNSDFSLISKRIF